MSGGSFPEPRLSLYASTGHGKRMRRREVIAGLASSAVASPLAVLAQQSPERVRRINVLMDLAADDPEARARLEVFRAKLTTLPRGQEARVR